MTSGNEPGDRMENAAIKLGTIPAGSVVTPELIHGVMVERIKKLEAENARLRAEVQRLARAAP